MADIDEYKPESGRVIKENGDVVNWADLQAAAYGQHLAFVEGRRFRASHKISLTVANPVAYLQFVISGEIELLFSRQTIVDGGADYEVFSGAQASGASGFVTPVPIYRSNNKSGVPTPSPLVDVFTGGTVTLTGVPNVTVQLRAGGVGNNSSTTTIGDEFPRGFPPTTAYVRLTRAGNQDADIVLDYEFNQE